MAGQVSSANWSQNNDAGVLDGFTSAIGKAKNDITGVTDQNIFASEEAEKARAFNSAEAKADRDWQEYMSNTSYQRQVADMKAAGINPASIDGNGASTPQGSRAAGGAQASASHPTNLGLASVAAAALRLALFNKFSNSAKSASSAAGAVKQVGMSLSAAQANEGNILDALYRRQPKQLTGHNGKYPNFVMR